MAEFLETTGISHELTKLIKGSEEKLILISPYLKTNENLRQRIREKDAQSITIKVVYRKGYKINEDELNLLRELKNREIYIFENLHAKCYLNENTAIITSMNLHDYSAQNNREMGVKIEKKSDNELYEDMFREVTEIIHASELVFPLSVEKVERENLIILKSLPTGIKNQQVNTNDRNGFCIRCGADLELNREKPMCLKCYKFWKKYKDPDFMADGYCHKCGKKFNSTFEKPFCSSCYKNLSA